MISVSRYRFGVIRALQLATLFVIVLVASTAIPVIAQASGTWAKTGSLNTTRAGHSATLLPNGQVLAAGGEGTTGFLNSAELYDPSKGKWTVTGSMASSRLGHSAALLPNGLVLVAGGIGNITDTGVVTVTATAELYNPSTGQWTATGSLNTARYGAGTALLQDGEVLVAGGVNPMDGTLASAELYDPTKGTWKNTGSMNDPRSTHAALLQNGQVLMAGGNGNTAELYSNGHWTLTSSMVFTHPASSAAPLTNGDALIFGGHLASYSSEFYNPSTNLWARTGNIAVNPPNGPLTLLGTGKVLLAGGESGYGTDALCRLYDSSSNAWLLTGSMNQTRTSHSATRLLNGQVLAAGGEFKNSSGTFTFLASAELYTP